MPGFQPSLVLGLDWACLILPVAPLRCTEVAWFHGSALLATCATLMTTLTTLDSCAIMAADIQPDLLLQSFLPVPYFASERSFAQYKPPEECKTIVGFGQEPNSLVVVGSSGNFWTATFDPDKGGLCQQKVIAKFLEQGSLA